MKDSVFIAFLLIGSIGLNITLMIVYSDCPPQAELERERRNVEQEAETLRRRLDQSIEALRDHGIPANEVFSKQP